MPLSHQARPSSKSCTAQHTGMLAAWPRPVNRVLQELSSETLAGLTVLYKLPRCSKCRRGASPAQSAQGARAAWPLPQATRQRQLANPEQGAPTGVLTKGTEPGRAKEWASWECSRIMVSVSLMGFVFCTRHSSLRDESEIQKEGQPRGGIDEAADLLWARLGAPRALLRLLQCGGALIKEMGGAEPQS